MNLRTVALSLAAAVLFLHSAPARAGVGEALDAALDASDVNDATESRCQAKLAAKLDAVIDSLRAAKKNPTDRAIASAKRKVKAAADVAEDRCPDRVGVPVGKKLDEVLDGLADDGGGGGGGDDAGGGGGGGGGGVIGAKFGTIKINNSTWDGRSTVEFNPRNIKLSGARGRNVFFAVGVRPTTSDEIEWTTLAAEQVQYDPAEWKDGGVFRYYTDWMTDHDVSSGKWVAMFVIYDADTRDELARKEINFTFTAPEEQVMDADSYDALLNALASSRTDFSRLDLVRDQLASQKINAAQLGPILDAFGNELLRLDAAKAAVPRVVNPSAALVWGNKFANSILADEYRGLCQ